MSREGLVLLALLAGACTPSEPQPLVVDEASLRPEVAAEPPAPPAATAPLEGPGIGEGTIQLSASGLVGRSSCCGPRPTNPTPLVRVLAGPLAPTRADELVGAALPELRRCLSAQTNAKDVEVTLVVEVEASGRVDAIDAQLDTSDPALALGSVAERALERCASEVAEPWRFAAAERASTFELAFVGE